MQPWVARDLTNAERERERATLYFDDVFIVGAQQYYYKLNPASLDVISLSVDCDSVLQVSSNKMHVRYMELRQNMHVYMVT